LETDHAGMSARICKLFLRSLLCDFVGFLIFVCVCVCVCERARVDVCSFSFCYYTDVSARNEHVFEN
jgi:hypothetical protein